MISRNWLGGMLGGFRRPDAGPVSGRTPRPDDRQAYALQAEITRLREQRGEQVIGYKVGCTSKPIQVQLGVDEPIFGTAVRHGMSSLTGVHLPCRRATPTWPWRESWRCGYPEDLPDEPVSEEDCREADRPGVSGDRVTPLCRSRCLASVISG